MYKFVLFYFHFLAALVGFWKFKESSPGIDESGNGNDAILENVVFVNGPSGKSGGAAYLDGTSKITIPNNGALDFGSGSYTLLFHIKSLTTDYYPIFEYDSPTGVNVGYMVWQYGGARQFYLNQIPRGSAAYSTPITGVCIDSQ